MEQKPKNSKMQIILVFLSAFIVVILGYYFLVMKEVRVDKTNIKEDKIISEEESIINANIKALEKAKSVAIENVRPIDDSDHIRGDIDAPVQLIIYNDFECQFCADFFQTVKQVEDYFGEKLVVAFRHYPLDFNALARQAALASECAAEQNNFWEMHDKLFASNIDNNFSIEQFKAVAEEIGLNTYQFNQCFDTEKYQEKIENGILEAESFGVTGAPTSFINSLPIPGAVPFEDFTDSQGREREGMQSIIKRQLNLVENIIK